MELLDRLKEEYQWQEVKFVNEALIETELGRKRLRYWSDKALLDWHIAWRDGCSVTPYMLADRMIRNKDQQASIEWKDGWVTVHDEVDNSFRSNQSEKKLGQMFGQMIRYGIDAKSEVTPTKQKEPLFQHLINKLSNLKEEQRLLVDSLIRESDIRMRKVKALTEGLKDDESFPLLDPIRSSEQGKNIHKIFIWFGSMSQPEQGYYSLRSFLVDWLGKNGVESLRQLLSELLENDAMTRGQSILLLAECLKPFELDLLVQQMESNPTERQLVETLEQISKEWEQSKTLVQELSSLIDKKKKVLTK
jgi:hypothetical protein